MPVETANRPIVFSVSVSFSTTLFHTHIDILNPSATVYAFSDAVFPLKRAREEAKDDDDRAGDEDIRRVVQCCEEEVVCRRSQVLSYFDEKFDAAQCRDGCDNCQSKSPIVEEDVTQDATKLIRLLMEIKEQMPEGLLVDVFRGRPSGSMKNRDLSYLQYMGAGKDVSKPQAGRIVHKLLANGIFQPESTVNKSGWNTTYLQVRTYNTYTHTHAPLPRPLHLHIFFLETCLTLGLLFILGFSSS